MIIGTNAAWVTRFYYVRAVNRVRFVRSRVKTAAKTNDAPRDRLREHYPGNTLTTRKDVIICPSVRFRLRRSIEITNRYWKMCVSRQRRLSFRWLHYTQPVTAVNETRHERPLTWGNVREIGRDGERRISGRIDDGTF